METLNLDLNKRYSYADYLTWFDNVRRELFDGFIKFMTPAPSRLHQKVTRKLVTRIDNFLSQKTCEIYFAPFDVRFPNNKNENSDNQIFTVVQPDVCIICDPSKLDDKGCLGAPDMIIEINSPNNPQNDIKIKFELYEKNFVREYWIVNPSDKNVSVFILNNENKFQFSGMYAGDDQIPVGIFDGELKINLLEVFDF